METLSTQIKHHHKRVEKQNIANTKQLNKYDIVMVNLGRPDKNNTTHVQKGYRPCVIINTNCNSPTSIIIPLSSRFDKRGCKLHGELNSLHELGAGLVRSNALCEQVTVIDNTSIIKVIGTLTNKQDIENIHRAINFLLFN